MQVAVPANRLRTAHTVIRVIYVTIITLLTELNFLIPAKRGRDGAVGLATVAGNNITIIATFAGIELLISA